MAVWALRRLARENVFAAARQEWQPRETDKALKGSGIACPNLHDYAWRLWDYWERHLDPDLRIDRTLRGRVKSKVVLITGGSSGIGLATAHKLAAADAVTVIVARDEEKLLGALARAGRPPAGLADFHVLYPASCASERADSRDRPHTPCPLVQPDA